MWNLKSRRILEPVFNFTGRAFVHDQPDWVATFASKIIKNYEVIPVLCTVVFSCSIGLYSLYHALGKTDVRFSKSKRDKLAPHEEIAPTQKTKLYTRSPDRYRPIRELENLKKDLKINEEEEENKCCCT